MVDEFAHTEVKDYGTPSMIEVDAYRKGINDTLRLSLKLEKQGEQKSADEVLKIRQEVYQSGYNDGYKHGIEDVKQGEQKPGSMSIKEKAHQIAWETSKHYDPLLSKECWCEMAVLDMASWLEKQGGITKLSEEEQNRFAKGVLSSCALSFIDYLDAHKYEGKMCVSNGECEDIENAFHNAMWDRLHRYYCKYIEKQGEQEPIEWKDSDEKYLFWALSSIQKDIAASEINGVNTKDLNDCVKWLYSLKQRIKEKQEPVAFNWSTDDKNNLLIIEQILECAGLLINSHELTEIKNWLKSLKQRIGG